MAMDQALSLSVVRTFASTCDGSLCAAHCALTFLNAHPLLSVPAQAVIGAGAAGLVAARELARAGHRPTVFEQGDAPGGVWVYSDKTEDDALGTREDRLRVHGSMYAGLR